MSKELISKEDRKQLKEDFMKEIKKNIIVFEIYEKFTQSKLNSNNKSSDDLQRLGKIQADLKGNREILQFIAEFIKE